MRVTKQSRPPGKWVPVRSFKRSQRRKAWSHPTDLMELPPEVSSTSFQTRVLLASFSWKDSSKKQRMLFRIILSNFIAGGFQGGRVEDFVVGGRIEIWPPIVGLFFLWRVLGKQVYDVQISI